MTSEPGTGMAPSLTETLAGYMGRTPDENADLERMRPLLETGDPWDRDTLFHFTGSALIVHPPTQRVLLRWHEGQGAWLQVGGHADPGETRPLEVALREGVEETALPDLVAWPDSALLHAVVVPVPASDREPAHEHADLRFVLATDQPEAARPEKPGAPVRWLSLDEARAATGEDNLRETLDRLEGLLARPVAG
ncbi:NUDIX domain-containing protein [Lipingzhangella sp. LS1_29]|uniref:NUDIX domain-containing protein n=1 Tax=Lipingzhangella rawalii TaxID=2055835 RepID=A0ABU2HAS6_9ACTN|nr:NUDIX domain-containing protein [Lipingzhangella rawalii]MDS1272423.1 NUDIX domain-containing protein [Lipingzhangella rawalii]